MALGHTQTAREREGGKKGFILFRFTPLSRSIAFVCVKAGGRPRGGFQQKGISLPATAAVYPCANGRQMYLWPSTRILHPSALF